MTKLPMIRCIALGLIVLLAAGCAEQIKEPAVAGSFYPADSLALSRTVTALLAGAAHRTIDGRLVALISPHAGYAYSGQVAAYGYDQLIGRDIGTVILIGPSHHYSFEGASVYARGAMKTPLGVVRINTAVAQELLNVQAQTSFIPEAFAREHSLEVQLPFLQEVLKDFRIVPVLIGSPTRASLDHLTAKLTEIVRRDNRTIIVASSDLSHYHPYATAVAMDRRITDAIERVSPEDVERLLQGREGEMCGGYPVILTLAVARNLGATYAVLFKYANSGDVTGQKDRVVGYASAGMYRSALSAQERTQLLDLAKKTIVEFITTGRIPEPEVTDPRLQTNAATFVTINRSGRLRGCIGSTQPAMPLYRSVIANAVAASSRDPRFHPMKREELGDMEVEVSVLSPFEPVQDIGAIEVGRHGLYLVKDDHTAVFLPQVPTEQGWDRTAYLEHLSQKAGLPKDAWKAARLYSFTAEVIR